MKSDKTEDFTNQFFGFLTSVLVRVSWENAKITTPETTTTKNCSAGLKLSGNGRQQCEIQHIVDLSGMHRAKPTPASGNMDHVSASAGCPALFFASIVVSLSA